MPDWVARLWEWIKSLPGRVPSYVALGSVALYVLGYLSIRHYFLAVGIRTEMPVIDERYLFEGADFISWVIQALCVPLWTWLAVPPIGFFALGVILWVAFARRKWCEPAFRQPEAAEAGADSSTDSPCAVVATVVGICLSLLTIPLFMLDCYQLRNVVLSSRLPDLSPYHFFWSFVQHDVFLYFQWLVFFVMVSAILFVLGTSRLFSVRTPEGTSAPSPPKPPYRMLGGIFAFLLALQVVLLPVNYGMLVKPMWLAKIASERRSGAGSFPDQWFLWCGKQDEWVAFLVKDRAVGKSVVVRRVEKNEAFKIQRLDSLVTEVLPEKAGHFAAAAGVGSRARSTSTSIGRALLRAAAHGDYKTVRLLLDEVDANVADDEGRTPLMRASEKGFEEIVRLLLARGSDPEAKDRGGKTALMHAVAGRQMRVAEILIEHITSNVNAQEDTGYAAMQGRPPTRLGPDD